MTASPEIVGDKLRKAILIVWFLNKFNENMPKATIRRMAGYQGSGIYSAMESGWFKEEQGKIILTTEAELYCEKKILTNLKIVQFFFIYAAYTLALLIVNEYLIIKFGIMIRFNFYTTSIAFIIIIAFWFLFYRIMWYMLKIQYKKNE